MYKYTQLLLSQPDGAQLGRNEKGAQMSYVDEVLQRVRKKDPDQPEFYQAVRECFDTVRPLVDANEKLYRENAVLERFVEPERMISFRVPWIDRNGAVQINRGWRVQFNSAIGSYKGGIRLRSTVNESIIKFLGFEIVLKNALTGLPMGGAKGGSDFDPKGKTDREVMNFCQSFVTELFKYVGSHMDCPAGDIGCGSREINYMFGQYKRLTGLFDGSFSGKDPNFGGSLVRREAAGYGLGYMAEEMAEAYGKTIRGKTVVVTGSGNVAIYAVEKCQQLGAHVIAMCDSDGYIVDPDGIHLNIVKQIKEVQRGRIREYADLVPRASYTPGPGIWNIPCDIYLPCATQNEISPESAETLVRNGVFLIAEGANMPADLDTIHYFQNHGVLYMPDKAANAGGVSVSGLEQTQNAMRFSWTFEEVDARLKIIMHDIFEKVSRTAAAYGMPNNYLAGANLYAFQRVAAAMIAQGIV